MTRSLVSAAFAQHVENITLNPGRDQKIQAYTKSIQRFAHDDAVIGAYRLFDPFVHGSYEYNTAVRPVGDIEYDLDMILPLQKGFFEDRNPSEILTHVARRLRGKYATVSQGRRCVRVSHADGFHVDVVPAMCPSGNTGPIWIPDKDSGNLIQSHPVAIVSWVAGLNAAACNRFAASVRILKRWRDDKFSSGRRPKSLLLTVLAGRALETSLQRHAELAPFLRNPTTDWPTYFRALLLSMEVFHRQVGARFLVPGVNDDIAARWPADARASFEDKFSSMLRHSEAAFESPTERGALTAWGRALGPSFPR